MASTNHSDIYQTLLLLLRKAVDNSCQVDLPKDTDWKGVLELASCQGVSGIWVVFHRVCPAFSRRLV